MRNLSPEQDLKLHMLADGVRIESDAEKAWGELYQGPMSLNEYASTSGICLKIEDANGGIWLNAPYTQDFAQHADTALHHDEGAFLLRRDDDTYNVDVLPVPAYHKKMYKTEEGTFRPYTDFGVTHTDRVRVSPIQGCGMTCRFCNIPYELKYRKKTSEEMLSVIELAKNDVQTPARHALISGGTPRQEDELWEDELYEAVIEGSPIPVDIMMTPREDPTYVKRLGAAGVNSLSVNIEVFDEQRARKLIPNKARRFGPQGYLDYIENAVGELGPGRVQSLILFGSAIEPLETTLRGVQALVDRGCIPVLSPFRPDPRTPMEHEAAASESEMREVYEQALDICEKAGTGVRPGPRCTPCHHNTVAFDDGSDFFIAQDEDITGALHVA